MIQFRMKVTINHRVFNGAWENDLPELTQKLIGILETLLITLDNWKENVQITIECSEGIE